MRCVRGRTGAGTVEEREAGSHWAGRDGMHRFSALICQEGGAVASEMHGARKIAYATEMARRNQGAGLLCHS